MSRRRVLSTCAVIAATAACAVAVIGLAKAQPTSADASATTSSSSTPTLPPATLPHSGAVAESVAGLDASATPVPSSTTATPTKTPTKTSAPKPKPATSTKPSLAPAPARPAAPPATSKPAPRPKPKPQVVLARGQALPLSYSTGNATRVITVVAPSTGSTTATLQAWNKAPGGGWLKYGPAIYAHIGSQGMTSHPSESLSATPMGSHTLTEAFGWAGNPGTGLPYIHTNSSDVWVDDPSSSYYNRLCTSNCAHGEHLSSISVYKYAVVMDYNRFPVTPGAGSAFFLHVTDGNATAGCVSIPEGNLVTIMRWLTPSAHPRILIGT